MNVAVWGGGAALAQPLIEQWLANDYVVYAMCKQSEPGVVDDSLRIEQYEEHWSEPKFDLAVIMPGRVANAKLKDMTENEWNMVMASCLDAPASAMRTCASAVKSGGSIVVIGSILGSTGGYGCANYAAAKAGLVGLVRAAANELASRRVCVNLLELGYCDVGMGARLPQAVKDKALETIPLKRFCTAQEFVDAVEFLGKCKYTTGNVLTLAGGLR